tara:strand:+ start:459 stop:647 length:189 start_codon:yes stop_codon:yes gene_type:complete
MVLDSAIISIVESLALKKESDHKEKLTVLSKIMKKLNFRDKLLYGFLEIIFIIYASGFNKTV